MQSAPALHSLQANLSVVFASTWMRLITISRYKGQMIMDIIVPVVMASMPILLGRATAGDQAGAIFELRAGTSNYVAYMLIGSAVFNIVSNSFWHIANWLRWEMQTGTLESLYMTPTERIWIAAGTALYSMLRSTLSALIAYLGGSLILGVNPLQGEIGLALVFILAGLLPVYGAALLFGALVLKLKEANALISLMQWLVGFLMGVYFPVAILPPIFRFLALAFPPTWMTNGVRSALLGVGYFFGVWYKDLAILWAFMIITPLVGYFIFTRVETGMRRNEGLGQF